MKSEVYRGELAPLTQSYLWKNWKEHRGSGFILGSPFYISLGGSSFLGVNIGAWTGPNAVQSRKGLTCPISTGPCNITRLRTLEAVSPPADTMFETDPAQILKLARRLASDRQEEIRLSPFGISLEPFDLKGFRSALTDAKIQLVPLGTETTENLPLDESTSVLSLGVISVLNSYRGDDESEVTLTRALPVFVDATTV
ncbi:hypothetical protein KBB49_02095 [Candidatus Saccharibacteria bacterium]|nr:hypothetical protein [Candidatus Saccharibacteria bacterium]